MKDHTIHITHIGPARIDAERDALCRRLGGHFSHVRHIAYFPRGLQIDLKKAERCPDCKHTDCDHWAAVLWLKQRYPEVME